MDKPTYNVIEIILYLERGDEMYTYKTSGVCAKQIEFNVEDTKLISVKFIGGCPGNALGLSKLIEGMDVAEAVKKLKGVACGEKNTSCPDQLAKALEELVLKK